MKCTKQKRRKLQGSLIILLLINVLLDALALEPYRAVGKHVVFLAPMGSRFPQMDDFAISVALGPVWNHCTVYCFSVLNLLKENGTLKGEAASVLIIHFKTQLWGEFTGMAKAVTNLFQLTV